MLRRRRGKRNARRNVEECLEANFTDDFGRFAEIDASWEGRACEKVFDQACTDVVTPENRWTEISFPQTGNISTTSLHLLELLVDLYIVFIVLDQLHYECSIREGEELCILRQEVSAMP